MKRVRQAPVCRRPHTLRSRAAAVLAFGLAALTLPLPLIAEEADEAAAEDERTWYEVELIVFRQWELGGSDAERWPGRTPEPHYPVWQVPADCEGISEPETDTDTYDAALDALEQEMEDDEIDSPAEIAPRDALRCLPEDRRRLTREWDELRSSGDYRPLYHLAWEQPGYAEADSVAIPVPLYWQPRPSEQALGIEPAPPRLEPMVYGLIRIYRERFLHAVVDLRFQRFGSGFDVEPEELLRAPVHVMREARRMRSSQLHYIDHPALGILIEIRERRADDNSG